MFFRCGVISLALVIGVFCQASIGEREYDAYFPSEDDLGFRFSKVYFEQSNEDAERHLPLTMGDFPLSPKMTNMLRESKCVSVTVMDDCAECDIPTEELVFAIGGYPNHPSSDPRSSFWNEFRAVIHAQKQRLTGVEPGYALPLPIIWQDVSDLEQVAEYVHDELPGTHHADLIRWLIAEGFKVDRTIIPTNSSVEFIRREVLLAYITTWAVSKVGPHNFCAKYLVGRARPEEVAMLIHDGTIGVWNGVPLDIVLDIQEFDLKTQFDFTAYPEGSPAHPSWPAMHSAGSAASLWLPVILHLTPEQICQTKLVDWAVSYARTVAGVHYPDDNIAGLNLGQEIIARKLPDHLANVYGSDPEVVRAKIEKFRFDWNDFANTDCYRNNILV